MSELPLAVVTGASKRLGKAFALTLARRGYAVLLHYHLDHQGANDASEELRALGVPVYLQQADLTDPQEIEDLFRLAASLPHPLKALVNSAALMQRGDTASMTAAEWDQTLALNLRAPFLCGQQAFRLMQEGGSIVNVSDVAARKTWQAYPAYTVSKAALEVLTRIQARSFAPKVRVNAIAPGLVMRSEVVTEEQWDRLAERLPLGRPAQLDEVTAALETLLDNDYMTGGILLVDGGYSLI